MSDWIESDPEILGGKPCVRGTRISVVHILELLSSGASPEQMIEQYPELPREGLNAALAYAAKALRNEVVWDVRLPTTL